MRSARRTLLPLLLLACLVGWGKLTLGQSADLSYVTPDATFAAVAFPARVLNAPEAALLPLEVFTAAGEEYAGFDPLDVEQVVAVAEAPAGNSPPGVAVVIVLNKPVAWEDLLPQGRDTLVEDTVDGRPALGIPQPGAPLITMLDEKTIVVATEPMMAKVLANHASPSEGRAAKLLAEQAQDRDFAAVLLIEPVRDLAQGGLMFVPIPPEFEAVRQLPRQVDTIYASLTLLGDGPSELVVQAVDEAAADQLEALVGQLFATWRERMVAEMQSQSEFDVASDDPVQAAGAQYVLRLMDYFMEMFRPTRDGTKLMLAGENEEGAAVATAGVLVALLLPAVQQAREAARRMQCMNNMKQIGLAIHNYYSANGHLPPRAIKNDAGEPLLSWRVALLPYLDGQGLYDEFHLDEPWDSPHNRALVERMPPFYQCPSTPASGGRTTYQVPDLEDGVITDADETTFAEITDGTSMTAMVVEVNPDRAVIWTRPVDWDVDMEDPLAALRGAHAEGGHVLYCDGSVRFLNSTIPAEQFRALLTSSGGETVDQY